MNAGREMDLLVAQRVFNATYTLVGRYAYLNEQFESKCPNYSTDISAAFEVVEKLRSQFTEIQITAIKGNIDADYSQNYYEVYIEELSKRSCGCPVSYGYRESAISAPEAICKAALTAAGVKL